MTQVFGCLSSSRAAYLVSNREMKPSAKLLIPLLALPALAVAGYAAKVHWCSQQLQTPIFLKGELTGKVAPVLAKLGEPSKRSSTSVGHLSKDKSIRYLFLPSDIAQLNDQPVEVLVWEQRCLGSTIWKFAVIVEPESQSILAVGGESEFYAPVYFGG